MSTGKRLSLAKPTLNTPFHIDFSWWSHNDREYKVYLRNLLDEDSIQSLNELDEDDIVDWVDPETAEVHQVDILQHLVISQFSKQEGFVSSGGSLVESIFRLFLKNGNAPLSVNEMGELLDREPGPILRLLSGRRVYKGLRPIIE